MGERRDGPRREIEEGEDHAPPAVLERHPAEEEKPHVAGQVQPAGVDEGAREKQDRLTAKTITSSC